MKRTPSRASIVSVLAEDWLEGLVRKGFSPETASTRRYGMSHVTEFLEHSGIEHVQDVTAGHVEQMRLGLIDRGLKDASIEVVLQSAKCFFAHLEDEQVIFVSPMRSMRVRRAPPPLQPVPTEEEIRRLLDQPNLSTPQGVRDRALLESGYSTGARRRELIRLCVADVDFSARSIRLMGRGDRERVVPLGAEAARRLDRYIRKARPKLLGGQSADELWITVGGRPLGYAGIQPIMKRHARAAGLENVTAHSLRRACATHMLHHGAGPEDIRMLLGHASLRHLSQYLRVSISDLRKAHGKAAPGR